jgi:putative transposase
MFAIHARIAFLPVVKGGFGNPKVSSYSLGIFASFVILEGMYDLAFGESGCFHRLNKIKFFSYLISPKFGEGYRLEVSDVQKLKTLEEEHSRLKRMYADLAMDNQALRDLFSKKGWALPPNGK